MKEAVRIRIYCDQRDRAGHRPLSEAVVQLLRQEHAAGVTVAAGIDGFGASRELHRSHLRDLGSPRQPVVIEWIDSAERVAALWPRIEPMVHDVLAIRDTVGVTHAPERRVPLLSHARTVREVMESRPLTMAPDASLGELTRIMYERDLRFVPVVDGGRLVGVVTNGDLVRHGVLPLRLELHRAIAAHPENPSGYETVRDVMTAEVVTTTPTVHLHEAAHVMIQRPLKRLPVIDQGHLVGVVSRYDVLRSVSAPDHEAEAPEVSAGASTVGEVARPEVPTVRGDSGLADVLDTVASTRLNRAVVVDEDSRVVGIISDVALLRHLEGASESALARLMHRVFQHAPDDPALHARTAVDVMISPVVTVARDTPIPDAIRLILAEGRKVLPVVDEQGVLCGIVDRADLLRAAFLRAERDAR